MVLNQEQSIKIINELGEMERCVPELIHITHGPEELEFMNGFLAHLHELRSTIDDAIIAGVR